MRVYLDNSATTRVRKEVLDEIIDVYDNDYGNPSSLHRMGLNVEKRIDKARKQVARVINAKAEEIYFTSGGTESNNLAINSHLSNIGNNKNIITTMIEHSSVYNVFKYYENNGVKVNYLHTDDNGFISLDELKNLVDINTELISIIMVNNEIGTIQDIESIIKIAKSINPRVKIHIDAIQAFGKIKIDVKKLDIDTMSFSSHKVHGPKGIGGLYCSSKCKLNASTFGGGQEKGIRPGTENTPGIIGFGKACEILYKDFDDEIIKLNNLKLEYAKKISELITDCKINSCLDDKGAPHILSVSFKDVRGEVLLHFLEGYDIYVSTGAACSSKSKNENRILQAINLDDNYSHGTIRISFGYFNNFDEIDYTVSKLEQCVEEIRSIVR